MDYPQFAVQFTQAGAILIMSIGPGLMLTQIVTPEQMDDLCAKWLAERSKDEPQSHPSTE